MLYAPPAQRAGPRVDYKAYSTSHSTLVLQYLDYIEKVERLSVATVLNRKYILLPIFSKLAKTDITDLTIQDIDEYFISRAVDLKPSSVNAQRQALRCFFEYCERYRNLPLRLDYTMIKRTRDVPPRVRTFSEQEIAHVISQAPELQDRLVIAVLYETGMRIGELLNLSVEDIRGTQIQLRGKGEKDRLVYVTQQLASALQAYIADRRYRAGKVFRPLQAHSNHPSDLYVSGYAVRDRIKRCFRQCGFIMHPHQLRHSFAVNMLEKGMDVRTLQKLLGHANLDTTMRYLNITDHFTESTYHRHQTTSVIR